MDYRALNARSASRAESGRPVVSNRGIARSQRLDVLSLFRAYVGVRGDAGTPDNLPPDRHVSLLLCREVRRYGWTMRGAEVSDAPCKIHADVNLPVREGKFINPLHGFA